MALNTEIKPIIYQFHSTDLTLNVRSPRSLILGHSQLVKILVILNSAGYMLTSSGFAFIHLRYIL